MMSAFESRPPVDAEALSERFGTPLWVFDGHRLAAEAEAFRAAWAPDDVVAYSMKANPLVGVVGRFAHAGTWIEVASGFEYRVARMAGVPGERIVFNGPLKTDDDLESALYEGATVIADGVGQVRALVCLASSASAGARVGLRVSPPDTADTDRFGLAARAVPAAARMLARAGLPVTGLHVHLGAYQLGPVADGPPVRSVTVRYPVPVERFARAALHVRLLAESIGGIEWLDLGGGWPAATALGPYRDVVEDALGPDRPSLILEPGRALVRDAGWLLVRVVDRRGRGRVVVDAGITHVPCVLWRRSPVMPARPRSGPVRSTDLLGPLCLQHDVIARAVDLPPLRTGDLVWLGQAGAYAAAQASPFIHLRPGAVMVEGGHATVLREREGDEEALAAQADAMALPAAQEVGSR